jgi:hypothetical protein
MPGPAIYTYAIESYDATGASPPAMSFSAVNAPTLTVDPWDWFQDVFPQDGGTIPGTPAFRRTTAKIRTGHNLAALTGTPLRAVTPGQHVIVHAPGAINVNITYRIKPGPGNYKVVGNPAAGLLWDPALPLGPVACPGDASWWGPYIGPPACPGAGIWNPDLWIVRGIDPIGGGDWQTTQAGALIFPDDLFTPGTVVQYYFTAQYAGGGTRSIPDPNCVMQLATQGSTDGHRWEQFTVLPDLWKEAAFGGLGLACVLVVDLDDGRGNERVWNGQADSLGLTRPAVVGRYNGTRAPSQVAPNLDNPVDLDSPLYFVNGPNGAAGTTWDLYSVRGSQSNTLGNAGSLGGRLGVVPAGSFPPGPTPAMLETYYDIVILLSGDRSAEILGPFADRSQDDSGILWNFLLSGTAANLRGLWAMGNGFVESADALPSNAPLLNTGFATSLRNASYAVLTTVPDDCIELLPQNVITTNGDIYGVGETANGVPLGNDVLDVLPGGVAASLYSPVGVAPAPLVASIYHDQNPGNGEFWLGLVDGWNIRDQKGRYCAQSFGRLTYVYNVLNDIFAQICSISGPPNLTLDVPASGTPELAHVLGLIDNPSRSGRAEIRFSLPSPDRVEASIHDLAGRLVRRIEAQSFGPGEGALVWDGKDDAGLPAGRGMYFVKVRFARAGVSDARKVVMLK